MFGDIRYHTFNVIKHDPNKWSTNWEQFSGLTYIPLVSELEEKILPFGDDLHEFMQQKWHYSIYISIVYIITIFILKNYMKTRKNAFNLRIPMAFWSSTLALFSIIGVIRCLPEFINILTNKGFTASFCDASYYKDWRLNLWYLFFVVSKALELIDTLFIVLRKNKLITLHWIHHCLTLSYSWYVFGDVPATARWMVNMNFIIHSIMYSYYALRAFRIQIPRVVNISITSLQILQMFYGLYINFRVINFKVNGIPCDLSPNVALCGLSLYSLFFALFVNYFVRSYLLKSSSKSMTFVCNINNNNNVINNNNNNNMSGRKEKNNNNYNYVSLERKYQ